MIVVPRTKPSGLYRHWRGLGLHRVGYRKGNLHIRSPKLASHAKERPTRTRDISGFPSLYLHSPIVRPTYIVRLSEDPLIQGSLTLLHDDMPILDESIPPMETTMAMVDDDTPPHGSIKMKMTTTCSSPPHLQHMSDVPKVT